MAKSPKSRSSRMTTADLYRFKIVEEAQLSPDGRWLAYLGSEGEGLWYQNIDLWIIPVDGSQVARNLTASFDITAVNITNGDMGAGGSYGGYLTNMIIGRAPDFFQAAVT